MSSLQNLVYLDAQASTPLCEEAASSMQRYVESDRKGEGGVARPFGNPHSAAHAVGWRAAEEVEKARGALAALLAVRPNEILFTSGATEANNTAIKGALTLRREREGRDGIVTLASEHKCVLEACLYAQRRLGARITIVPVERDGLVDIERVRKAIDDKTALLSVMAANNEIGVLQPLEELAEAAHAKGAWIHTDAAQALGKTAFDCKKIDLASFSAHKSYGPIGIGALYVAHRRRVAFEPLLHGGGQEGGGAFGNALADAGSRIRRRGTHADRAWRARQNPSAGADQVVLENFGERGRGFPNQRRRAPSTCGKFEPQLFGGERRGFAVSFVGILFFDRCCLQRRRRGGGVACFACNRLA